MQRPGKSKWGQQVVAVQRVTKVVKGGRVLSFRSVVVIGNRKGAVGVGMGKAKNVLTAIKRGNFNGKKGKILIPITSSQSIPHSVNGCFGAAKLILRPSAPGSGVIAGSSIRVVLELGGIKNILSKQLGSSNLLNNAKATINGLCSLRSYSIIK